MKKTLISALILSFFISGQVPTAYASEETGVAGQIEVTTGTNSGNSSDFDSGSSTSGNTGGFIFDDKNSGSNILESSGLIQGNVTTDDLGNKLEEKGKDVIRLMVTIGRYVCIGGFIFSCIAMFVGLFGNKRSLMAGFIGIILSGVMYAAIVMSDDIVLMIANWAAS